MRERPILFNTEMVKAILDGRKACTRRVVKGYIPKDAEFGYTAFTPKGAISCRGMFETGYPGYGEKFIKLPYRRGAILYVRETWQKAGLVDDFDHVIDGTEKYYYAAGPEAPCFDFWVDPETGEHEDHMPWKPSIHMPKEAARIWLKVTDVRVERLQEITEEGAKAEGMPDDLDYPVDKAYCPVCNGIGLLDSHDINTLGHVEIDCESCNTYVKRFKNLWNTTINGKDIDTYGWDANPYVWVIEFERCEKPGKEQ